MTTAISNFYVVNHKSVVMLRRKLPRLKPYNRIHPGRFPCVVHLNLDKPGHHWSRVLTLIVLSEDLRVRDNLTQLLEHYRRKL